MVKLLVRVAWIGLRLQKGLHTTSIVFSTDNIWVSGNTTMDTGVRVQILIVGLKMQYQKKRI